MSLIDRMIESELNLAEVKQKRLEETAAKKKQEMDPNRRVLSSRDDFEVIDGDTIFDKRLNRSIRFGAEGGRTVDTYETYKQRADGTRFNPYAEGFNGTEEEKAEAQKRFEQHERAYSSYLNKKDGFFRKGVTPDQLADYGEVQKARLQAELDRRLEAGEEIAYSVQGAAADGKRLVGVFEGDYFDNMAGRENNAAYYSSYNKRQRLDDILGGKSAAEVKLKADRGLVRTTADQAVNFSYGLGTAAAETLEALGIAGSQSLSSPIPGIENPLAPEAVKDIQNKIGGGVAAVFGAVKGGMKKARDFLISDVGLNREEFVRRESAINKEVFEVNKAEYIAGGVDENTATFLAAGNEAVNTVRNLAQDPGRVLDMTFESLPYMFAVAGASKIALRGAIKSQREKILKELVEGGADDIGTLASKRVDDWLKTDAAKAELAKIATAAGTTTVGLMEGASSAASVYDRIMGMTKEEAMQSENYQALIDGGKTHEQALQELATEAFNLTFGVVAVGAAAIGKATGAVAFESKILTSLLDTKNVVRNATQEGASRSIGQHAAALGKGLAREVYTHSGPASRELVEEAFQSGGGQLVQDIATQSVTGIDQNIGEGIGEAVATGAAAGAFSGGGISAAGSVGKGVVNGMGKALSMSTTGDDVKDRTIRNAEAIGGSDEYVQQTVAPTQGKSEGEIQQTIKELVETPDDPKTAFEKGRVLAQLTYSAELNGHKISDPELKKKVEVYIQEYKGQLRETLKAAESVENLPEEVYDDLARQAGMVGLELPADLPESAQRTYNMSMEVTQAINEAHEASLDTVTNRESKKGAEQQRVYEEKFGMAQNSEGKFGLRALGMQLTQALANKDMEGAAKALEQINFFNESQQAKVAAIKGIISAGKAGNLNEAKEIAETYRKNYGNPDQSLMDYNGGRIAGLLKIVEKEAAIQENMTARIRAVYDTATSSPAPSSEANTQSGSEAVVQVADDEAPTSEEGQEPSTSSTDEASPDLPERANSAAAEQDENTPESSQEPVEDDNFEEPTDDASLEEMEALDALASREAAINEEAGYDAVPPQDDGFNPEIYGDDAPPEFTDEDWAAAEAYEESRQENDPFYGDPSQFDDSSEVLEEWDQEIDAQAADDFIESAEAILNGEEVETTSQQVIDTGADLSRTRQSRFKNFGNAKTDAGKQPAYTAQDKTVDERAEGIIRAFVRNKLPVSINRVLSVASEKTTNLLAAVPNFRNVFLNADTRLRLAEKLGLVEEQKAAMSGVAAFMGEFTRQLNTTRMHWMGPKAEDRDNKFAFLWRANGRNAVQLLRQDGFQYLYDRLGNLHPNVEAAMALAGYQWIATRGVGGIQNDDDRINYLLGRSENTEVTDEERKQFGRGTPRSQVAQAIGRQVLKSLNLKEKNRNNPNMDSLFMDRLEMSIGQMVLGTMIDMGTVGQVTLHNDVVNSASKKGDPLDTKSTRVKDEMRVSPEGKQSWIFAKGEEQEDGSYTLTEGTSRIVKDYTRNALLLEKLFGFPGRARPPVFEKPGMEHVPEKYSRSETRVPTQLRENVNKNQQKAFHTNRELISMAVTMGREAFVVNILGAPTQEDIDKAHYSEVDSLKGKRNQALRSYDEAVNWDNEAGDSEFYFTYDITSTGRINLSSNTINPQNNTMHRWLYRMQEWATDVRTDVKDDTYKNFMVAVGLGLHIDLSLYTRNGIVERMEALQATLQDDGVLDAVNKLNEGEVVSEAEMAKIYSAVKSAGEGMHSLAALEALAGFTQAQETGDVYYTTLPVETDGKTNGFAAGMLQTPGTVGFLNPVKRMLEGTGIYFADRFNNGKVIKNYPQFKTAGRKDNYQEIAGDTGNNVELMTQGRKKLFEPKKLRKRASDRERRERVQGEIIRNNVTRATSAVSRLGVLPTIVDFAEDVGRKFAKNPLTVVAYMGGMGGVKQSMTDKAISALYGELSNITDLEGLANWHNKVAAAVNNGNTDGGPMMRAATVKSLTQQMGKQSFDEFRQNYELSSNAKENKAFKENLNKAIFHTYGYALEAALRVKMEPFEEVRSGINHIANAMNSMFVDDFVKRISEIKERTGQEVSDAARRRLLQQMIEEGAVPTIRTALSESFLDSIQITDAGKIYFNGSENESARFAARANFNAKETRSETEFNAKGVEITPVQVASMGSPLTGYEPGYDIGVTALVKMIHSSDGAVNSHLMGLYAMLNVHDAQIGGINQIDEIAQAGNAEFGRLHREWDVGQEILNSYDRMVKLWEKKNGIQYVPNKAEQKAIKAIKNNTAARKSLFKDIAWVNQFAKEGTEAPMQQQTPSDGQSPEDVEIAAVALDMELSASTLIGDPAAAFMVALNHNKFTPTDVLDILTEYLDNRTRGDQREVLARVMSNIRNNLPAETKIVTTSNMLSKEASAQYDPDTNTVFVYNKATPATFSEILHELNHAAIVPQVEAIKDTQEFIDLLYNTNEFVQKAKRSKDPVLEAAARAIEGESSNERKVAEYLAYATTGLRPTGSGLVAIASVDGSFQQASMDLAKVVNQGINPGGSALQSTGIRPNEHSWGANVTQNTLNAGSFSSIMEELANIEGPGALSPVGREMLDNLKNNHILPALRDMDDIIVRRGTNPNGKRNVGEILDDGTIYLEAAGANLVVPGSMSLQETFVHEVMHAITKAALNENIGLRNKAQRIYNNAAARITVEDFLSDPANSTQFEREEAQRLYDYLFVNAENQDTTYKDAKGKVRTGAPRYLHEFMALATTNSNLNAALEKLDSRVLVDDPNSNLDLIARISGFVKQMFQYLSAAMRAGAGKAPKNLGENVEKLLVDISNIRREQISRTQWAIDKASDVSNWTDKQALAIADRLTKQLKEWAANQNTPENIQRKPLRALRAMALNGMQADVQQIKEVLDEFSSTWKQDTWFQEILSEVMPYPEKNKSWISMLRRSQHIIDSARQQAIEYTRQVLNDSFDSKVRLTNGEREAVTYALINTDASALLRDNFMDMGRILDVLRNPSKRASEMKKLENQIKDLLTKDKAGKEYFNWIQDRVNNLGIFMAKGTVLGDNISLNARNIVNQFGLDTNRYDLEGTDKAELIKLVDRLASLSAISNQDTEQINRAVKVFEHELSRGIKQNGMYTILTQHLAFVDESRNSVLKGELHNEIKGYTQEIYDSTIDVQWRTDTPANRAEMERKGYKFHSTLEKDPNDPGPRQAMFVSHRGIASYNKSIVSLNNPRKRGTSIYDGIADQYVHKKVAARHAYAAVGVIKAEASRNVKNVLRGSNLPSEGKKLLPVFNADGTVKDYRYVMSESTKREVLGKRNYFNEVLPGQVGSIIDRTETKTINREVVDLMKKEWDKFGGFDENGERKSFSRFKEIRPTSEDKEATEMWRLLPDDMKKAAKEAFGEDVIYLREEAVTLVLGFRKLSLAQGKVGEFLGPLAPAVRIAEKVWQEALTLLRHKIAITTPQVVVGNITSNAAVLLVEGISPAYIVKKSQEGIVNMRKYQREKKDRDMLERRVLGEESLGRDTRADRAKLARMDASLRSNPVHFLIEEGLFTSIVEDLGYDEERTSTKLINRTLDKVSSATPKIVTTVGKEAYMLPGSQLANAALVATQLGDFTARYVKLSHDMENGMSKEDAINEALSTFIYYNMPQNQYLQWLNDNGFMMFTKFFLRIQPVIFRLFKENPVKASSLLLGQQLLKDVNPVLGENVANYAFMSGATHKFELLPYKYFTGENGDAAYKPVILEWLSFFGIGD